MSYKQIKELVALCNTLGIDTLGQLKEFRERFKCNSNTALLAALQTAVRGKL